MSRGRITQQGDEIAGNGPCRAGERRTALYVTGLPIAQGSMSAFPTRSGRIVVTDQKGPNLKSWRTQVANAARQAHDGEPFDGPVSVSIAFVLPRPKKHYRTGRFAHLLRPDAPTWHTTKPDIDKLERAILDALTQSGTIHDDAQVARLNATKTYGDPGAGINIKELP